MFCRGYIRRLSW
uniref:Uncharacterized protein n=2 Tax=Timema TaxID=61471 RepID=A0A7R9B4U6_TIMSH|nr:unnamed protein product [Timema shepardi]CAD7576541.1 unnamed protein product [Timema californicum]